MWSTTARRALPSAAGAIIGSSGIIHFQQLSIPKLVQCDKSTAKPQPHPNVLPFYDLGGILSEIDGLLKYLSNNYGTVTGGVKEYAGVQDCKRFKVMFPFVEDRSGDELVVDVLDGNMALAAAKAALFKDWKLYETVLNTTAPNECRDLMRKLKNRDETLYSKYNGEFAFEIAKQKALQCPVIRAILCVTDDAVLAHAAPLNKLWGTGQERDDHSDTWEGQNLLGEVWMLVRAALRDGVNDGSCSSTTTTSTTTLNTLTNTTTTTATTTTVNDGGLENLSRLSYDEAKRLYPQSAGSGSRKEMD